MGKVLVLYHSDSGDTANMAKFVAEGVRSVDDTELRFKTINAADSDDLRKKRPRIESFH
jgi:NAD(P)H dehydrogenase (quinone)